MNIVEWKCDKGSFLPVDFCKARWLDWEDEDYELFRQFCGYPMPRARYEAIRQYGCRVGAIIEDGKIVASAGAQRRSGDASEVVSVRTPQPCQGRGYAKAVVSFVTAQILAAGRIPTLETRHDKVAMLHIAELLGYRRVG